MKQITLFLRFAQGLSGKAELLLFREGLVHYPFLLSKKIRESCLGNTRREPGALWGWGIRCREVSGARAERARPGWQAEELGDHSVSRRKP